MIRITVTTFTPFLLLLLWPEPGGAYPVAAYIDPGTGALILQAIAAAAVGSVIFARKQLARAGRWVGGLFGRTAAEEGGGSEREGDSEGANGPGAHAGSGEPGAGSERGSGSGGRGADEVSGDAAVDGESVRNPKSPGAGNPSGRSR